MLKFLFVLLSGGVFFSQTPVSLRRLIVNRSRRHLSCVRVHASLQTIGNERSRLDPVWIARFRVAVLFQGPCGPGTLSLPAQDLSRGWAQRDARLVSETVCLTVCVCVCVCVCQRPPPPREGAHRANVAEVRLAKAGRARGQERSGPPPASRRRKSVPTVLCLIVHCVSSSY